MYNIVIVEKSILDEYLSEENAAKYDINKLLEQLPNPIRQKGCVELLEEYDIGVFFYSREDVKNAFYEKNGFEMPIDE